MAKRPAISDPGEILAPGALVLLDGATGTELDRRGVNVSMPIWSATAIIEAPEVLREIHRDYLIAGAHVITANTFRTHKRSLSRVGLGERASELTSLAVAIAREACAGVNDRALVAGSIAPLEDCYSPELVPPEECLQIEHTEMAYNLLEAGVDLLLVETMNTVREAVAAARAAVATGLPSLVSVVCGSDARLLSGETLASAAKALTAIRPDAILVNCTPAPQLGRALSELRARTSLPIGAYGNVGDTDDGQNWVESDASDPELYSEYASHWKAVGATLIGGCCGTTPSHIASLRARLLE